MTNGRAFSKTVVDPLAIAPLRELVIAALAIAFVSTLPFPIAISTVPAEALQDIKENYDVIC